MSSGAPGLRPGRRADSITHGTRTEPRAGQPAGAGRSRQEPDHQAGATQVRETEDRTDDREDHAVEIKGKKAVVVGGASGMAKASAELLRQKGADIAILDLPTSAGAEVAKALGGTFHEVDVLDENQVESALGDAVAALGGLHIAVNTAGGGTAIRTLISAARSAIPIQMAAS